MKFSFQIRNSVKLQKKKFKNVDQGLMSAIGLTKQQT